MLKSIKTVERVTFDPSNKDHRKAASAYLQRFAWEDSPIKFKTSGLFNLDTEIHNSLTRYYLEAEFSQVEKEA